MSSIADLDDPDFDADPAGDAAAYDEWAAMAVESAPPPQDDVRPDAACRPAFDAIAAGLTPVQIAAACHQGSILVLAGAGTGKTSTLTAAVAHRIAVDGVPPRRVLAVTFTNKAAGEMLQKNRRRPSAPTPLRPGSGPSTGSPPVSCAPRPKSRVCATISTSLTPTIPEEFPPRHEGAQPCRPTRTRAAGAIRSRPSRAASRGSRTS